MEPELDYMARAKGSILKNPTVRKPEAASVDSQYSRLGVPNRTLAIGFS